MRNLSFLFAFILSLLPLAKAEATEVTLHSTLPGVTEVFSCEANWSNYLFYTWDDKGDMTVDLPAGGLLSIQVSTQYNTEVTLNGDRVDGSGGYFLMNETMIAKAASDGQTPHIEITVTERPATYVILHADNKMVSVSYRYSTIPNSDWNDGELKIKLTDLYEPVIITAKTDYAIKAVMFKGNDELETSPAGRFAITTDMLEPGDNIFDIEAYNLEEARTEAFTLVVKDGSVEDLNVRRNGSLYPLPTSALTRPITFDPATELPISISHSVYARYIYSVSVDGKPVTKQPDGSFLLYDLKNGAEVVVTVNFPDIEVPVRFNFLNPDTEGAVLSVTNEQFNIIPAQTWQAEDFTMPLGSILHVNLDNTNYIVTASLNGEGAYTDHMTVNIDNDSPYEITIDAEPKEPYAVSVMYVGPPAHFQVLLGNDNEIIEMTGKGQTSFNVKRNNNRIRFVAEEGWAIIGVYVEGEEVPADTYVTSDTMYEVYVEPFERNLSASVFFSPEGDWIGRCVTLSQGVYGREKTIYPESPYTLINYNADELPLSIEAYLANAEVPVCLLNGVKVDYDPVSPSATEGFATMPDNSVIKFFAEEPRYYTLSVTVEDDALATVVLDLVKELGEETETAEVTEDTLVQVFSDSEQGVDVTVNGELIEADAYGVVSFYVNADTVVVIEEGSWVGVSSVAAGATSGVYSLQGYRIRRAATAQDLKDLPEGLYIIDGHKVKIRR